MQLALVRLAGLIGKRYEADASLLDLPNGARQHPAVERGQVERRFEHMAFPGPSAPLGEAERLHIRLPDGGDKAGGAYLLRPCMHCIVQAPPDALPAAIRMNDERAD